MPPENTSVFNQFEKFPDTNLEVPHPYIYRATSHLFDPLFGMHGDVGIHNSDNLPAAGEPCILAADHRSSLDIPALGRAMLQIRDISVHFMAKKELWGRKAALGTLGAYIALCGAFAIDRDTNIAKQREVIDHVEELINDGAILATFPEGTRKNKDIDIVDKKDLKPTIGLFAAKFGLKIVPVGIAGTHKSDRWPVEIAFGVPVETERIDFDLFDPRQANKVKRDYVKPHLFRLLHSRMQDALDVANEQRELRKTN